MLNWLRERRFNRDLNRDVIPEIDVAPQCEHGCFQIVAAGPVLWRFAGTPSIVAAPFRKVMIHSVHCEAGVDEDHSFCRALCWESV